MAKTIEQMIKDQKNHFDQKMLEIQRQQVELIIMLTDYVIKDLTQQEKASGQ